MRRMFCAEAAVLFIFNSPRLLLFVFGRRIISMFANGTFQGNDVSHDKLLIISFTYIFSSFLVELATGLEPVTSSLPRKCSTS
jgi:hypothetical protein